MRGRCGFTGAASKVLLDPNRYPKRRCVFFFFFIIIKCVPTHALSDNSTWSAITAVSLARERERESPQAQHDDALWTAGAFGKAPTRSTLPPPTGWLLLLLQERPNTLRNGIVEQPMTSGGPSSSTTRTMHPVYMMRRWALPAWSYSQRTAAPNFVASSSSSSRAAQRASQRHCRAARPHGGPSCQTELSAAMPWPTRSIPLHADDLTCNNTPLLAR